MRDRPPGTERRGRPGPGGRQEADRDGVLSAEDLSLQAKRTAIPSDTGTICEGRL